VAKGVHILLTEPVPDAESSPIGIGAHLHSIDHGHNHEGLIVHFRQPAGLVVKLDFDFDFLHRSLEKGFDQSVPAVVAPQAIPLLDEITGPGAVVLRAGEVSGIPELRGVQYYTTLGVSREGAQAAVIVFDLNLEPVQPLDFSKSKHGFKIHPLRHPSIGYVKLT